MKKVSKKLAAGLLAVSIATTGLTANFTTAEAFGLGDVLGGVLGGGGGGGAVDEAGLTKQQNNLLSNLAVSTAVMNAAYQNAQIASGETRANSQLIATEAVTRSVVKTDMSEATKMKDAVAKAKKDKTDETIKKNLSAALTEADETKLKEIDSYIKTANQQRMLSDALGVLAVYQAGVIVKETAKGGLSLANAGNIIKFAQTAKQVQSYLKVRSQLSKMLSDATKDYKAARGIKDPSKAEIEKTVKTMEAND